MVTKKKARKNEDFKKVKLKVGKKLKKTTTTDTTIKAKKVVLISQLEEKVESDDKPLSFRGLTLDELVKQLGHFNKNIRNGAMVGLKQILTSRPNLIPVHLRTLIPSISRLISDNTLEPSHHSQLRALLKIICTVSESIMAAHISLFLAHVYRGLSHMEMPIRLFALSILSTLIDAYPKLCRNNPDLFSAFINFLGSSKKPKWNSPKFLDTVVDFVNIYDVERQKIVKVVDIEMNFEEEKMKATGNLKNCFGQSSNPFDFAVVSSSKVSAISPFELPSALLNLTKVLAPLITTSILEDVGGAFLPQTIQLVESIVKAAETQQNDFLLNNFRKQIIDSMEPVRKAILKRKGKSDKLRQAAKWLIID